MDVWGLRWIALEKKSELGKYEARSEGMWLLLRDVNRFMSVYLQRTEISLVRFCCFLQYAHRLNRLFIIQKRKLNFDDKVHKR